MGAIWIIPHKLKKVSVPQDLHPGYMIAPGCTPQEIWGEFTPQSCNIHPCAAHLVTSLHLHMIDSYTFAKSTLSCRKSLELNISLLETAPIFSRRLERRGHIALQYPVSVQNERARNLTIYRPSRQ